MSLINEALKRAQHQRKVEEAGFSPPVPGGSGPRILHRGKPMASQTLLLLVAGSALLIVLSVVATVYLLREPAAPAVHPAQAAPVVSTGPAENTPTVVLSIPSPPPAPSPETAPAPVVSAPVRPPATEATQPVTPPVPSGSAEAASGPPTTPGPAKPSVPAQAVATTPPPAPKSEPPVAAAPKLANQQVLVFLDNLKVLGVRFSGIDSKVLIGDRVFRVNDVIERNYGLRLVEVQPDRLFFVDAQGVAYTKNL